MKNADMIAAHALDITTLCTGTITISRHLRNCVALYNEAANYNCAAAEELVTKMREHVDVCVITLGYACDLMQKLDETNRTEVFIHMREDTRDARKHANACKELIKKVRVLDRRSRG